MEDYWLPDDYKCLMVIDSTRIESESCFEHEFCRVYKKM